MGGANSTSQGIKFVFNAASDQEFHIKLTTFLSSNYEPISPQEARQIIKLERFNLLFEFLVDSLKSDNLQCIKNSLKYLTLFIPIIYEDEETYLRILLQGNSKVEVEVNNRLTVLKVDPEEVRINPEQVSLNSEEGKKINEEADQLDVESLAQPQMHRILKRLCNLLFKPGFTIQGQDGFSLDHDPRLKDLLQQLLDKKFKVKLNQLWRGLATFTKYPNDNKQFYENRVLIASCLIACLGEQLYYPAKLTALNFLITEDHIEMFVSFWAIILFYKRSLFWFQDNFLVEQKQSRLLACLCSQIMLVVLSYESMHNKFRNLILQTNLLDYSVDLLVENISQSFDNDTKLTSIKGHNNKGVQETLGLMYFLLVKNTFCENFIKNMKDAQIQNILNILIYYIHEFYLQRVNFHIYCISLEILFQLLKYENIGKYTQKQMNFSIDVFSGTYQECIISFFSVLLSKTYADRIEFLAKKKSSLIINYRSDALSAIIERISIYVRNLNKQPSELLVSAINNYFTYEFLYQSPQNYVELVSLSIAFINIVHFQNNKLLYASLLYPNMLKFKTGSKHLELFFNKHKILFLDQKDPDQNNQKQEDKNKIKFQENQEHNEDAHLKKEEKEVQNENNNNENQQLQEQLKKFKSIWLNFDYSIIIQMQSIISMMNDAVCKANYNPATIQSEEFHPIYTHQSWSYVKLIQRVNFGPTFNYLLYSYFALLQQLEYMPIFNLSQCKSQQ